MIMHQRLDLPVVLSEFRFDSSRSVIVVLANHEAFNVNCKKKKTGCCDGQDHTSRHCPQAATRDVLSSDRFKSLGLIEVSTSGAATLIYRFIVGANGRGCDSKS